MELYSNVLQGPPTKKYLDVMKHSLAKTVNFRGKIIAGGYPANVLKQMLEAVDIYSKKRDIKIAVLNDFALEATIELLRLDFCNISHIITDENIMDWVEEQFISAYKCPVEVPLIKFEELKLLKPEFDLIIANPPYSIGNDITSTIINNCNFKEYVNLMPLSKYKKGKLFKHVVKRWNTTNWQGNTGEDIWTFPEICLLSKNSYNNASTMEDFERKFIYKKELSKFFDIQAERKETFVEHIYICAQRRWEEIKSDTSFVVGIYTPMNLVGQISSVKARFDSGYTLEEYFKKDCWATTGRVEKKTGDRQAQYVWNFLKPDKPIDKVFVPVSNGTLINQIITIFKTEKEKDNFVNWWYSAELSGRPVRSGLSSILLWAMNKPTGCPFSLAIPRVDWSRAWTDREILEDYGYSEKEIDDILSIDVTARHS